MSEASEAIEVGSPPRVRYLVMILAGVLVLWVACPIAMRFFFETDLAKSGQAGDLFGAVNALFSGLAFAALFYTILLQRHELALQRQELRLQREEMGRQRETMDRQAAAQGAQVLAAVAQLRVAAIELKARAIDFESLGVQEHGRTRYAAPIQAMAAEIDKLADVVAAGKE